MSSVNATTGLGNLRVVTTNQRGASVEEVANRALDKIVQVSETANPLIRDQALAYKEQIRLVLEFYMREAIRGNNTSLANRFRNAGYAELIPLILENE